MDITITQKFKKSYYALPRLQENTRFMERSRRSSMLIEPTQFRSAGCSTGLLARQPASISAHSHFQINGKKGFFFTFIAILIVFLVFFFTQISSIQNDKPINIASNARTEKLNSFVENIKVTYLSNMTVVAGIYAINGMNNYLKSTGTSFSQSEFKDEFYLMLTTGKLSTTKDPSQTKWNAKPIPDLIDQVITIARDQLQVKLSITVQTDKYKVYQADTWNVGLELLYQFTAEDIRSDATPGDLKWTGVGQFEKVKIDISGFEDPLYLLHARDPSNNPISPRIVKYNPPPSSWSMTTFINNIVAQQYVADSNAPNFIQRFSNSFAPHAYGISSLVDPAKLIPVQQNKEVPYVDYIFFKPSLDTYPTAGVPSTYLYKLYSQNPPVTTTGTYKDFKLDEDRIFRYAAPGVTRSYTDFDSDVYRYKPVCTRDILITDPALCPLEITSASINPIRAGQVYSTYVLAVADNACDTPAGSDRCRWTITNQRIRKLSNNAIVNSAISPSLPMGLRTSTPSGKLTFDSSGTLGTIATSEVPGDYGKEYIFTIKVEKGTKDSATQKYETFTKDVPGTIGCSDTDGGQASYTYGSVALGGRAYGSDSCVSGTRVNEYYCSGEIPASTQIDCSYRCDSGGGHCVDRSYPGYLIEDNIGSYAIFNYPPSASGNTFSASYQYCTQSCLQCTPVCTAGWNTLVTQWSSDAQAKQMLGATLASITYLSNGKAVVGSGSTYSWSSGSKTVSITKTGISPSDEVVSAYESKHSSDVGCLDSDGGNTPNTAGNAVYSGVNHNDACTPAAGAAKGTVGEFFCDINNVGQSAAVECEYDCEVIAGKGRCKAAPSCTETDGGNMPNIAGSTTYNGVVNNDICIPAAGATKGTVGEYYCDGPNALKNALVECANDCEVIAGKGQCRASS